MSTLEAARQIKTEAATVLADVAEVGNVYATTDPRELPSKLAGGDLCVVVNPPNRTFDTYHAETWEWDVWIVAGPGNRLEAAWARLDAAVEALAGPLDADSARSDAFSDPQRATYPAFVLTITTHR